MSNISHARVDYRLIHGQVITKQLKMTNAKKIVIVDNILYKDAFLARVSRMAAPSNIKVDIIPDLDVISYFENNNEEVFLLFRDIETAKKSIELGLELDELQIGGLENSPGKKIIHQQLSLNKEDYLSLEKIESHGTTIYLQTIPGEKKAYLNDIKKEMGI